MERGIWKGKRLWWMSIGIWLIVTIILSGIAPAAKEYVIANKDAGLPAEMESIIADRQLEKHFPKDGGLPLFAVIHKEEGLSDADILQFAEALEAIEVDEDEFGTIGLPALTAMPEEQRAMFLAEDGQTYFATITVDEALEGKELNALVKEIKSQVSLNDVELTWTGPAGIASDAVELFSDANLVLLLSTVGIILVLLLIIYRSPLLALIPLIGAAIVYSLVDRVIGLTASFGWFTMDSQALSIMTILLFAVVTDYSLLIFSRYREELKKTPSTDEAMRTALRQVREPIFFSGSTIVLGVSTLIFTLYEPYRNFAPVFIIAAAAMLIAGLTLLPALFAVVGRKAFWPVIPKVGEASVEKSTLWRKVANVVTTKPWVFVVPILLLLVAGSWNMTNTKESYDLIASFPEDLSSRVGYERLSDSYGPGNLAPATLLIESDSSIGREELEKAINVIQEVEGVDQVVPMGHPLSEDGKNAKLMLTFTGNPYDAEALDTVLELREKQASLMKEAGLPESTLHIAGESAINADIREASDRDTWVVMLLMTIMIAIMLGLQTRSILAPIYMVGTILLSFGATMGLSIFLFDVFLDLDAISYRIPLYTFVFLVALGVDYSIMLIARIREEMKVLPFDEAVRKGLERTGGVISSAGLILAATFFVLTTMPINELKLFGFMMALGILMDTFIVRPLVIPAILVILGKWSFWPRKMN